MREFYKHIKNVTNNFPRVAIANSVVLVNMEVCERSSCVHGYHIYKDIWDPITCKELRCEREPDTNRSDQ